MKNDRLLTIGIPRIDPITRRPTGELKEVEFVHESDRAELERLGLVKYPKAPAGTK